MIRLLVVLITCLTVCNAKFIRCNSGSDCPAWHFCSMPRAKCMPCTLCDARIPNRHSECISPTRCRDGRTLSCPKLELTAVVSCTSGDKLGSTCTVACENGTQQIRCEWNKTTNKETWSSSECVALAPLALERKEDPSDERRQNKMVIYLPILAAILLVAVGMILIKQFHPRFKRSHADSHLHCQEENGSCNETEDGLSGPQLVTSFIVPPRFTGQVDLSLAVQPTPDTIDYVADAICSKTSSCGSSSCGSISVEPDDSSESELPAPTKHSEALGYPDPCDGSLTTRDVTEPKWVGEAAKEEELEEEEEDPFENGSDSQIQVHHGPFSSIDDSQRTKVKTAPNRPEPTEVSWDQPESETTYFDRIEIFPQENSDHPRFSSSDVTQPSDTERLIISESLAEQTTNRRPPSTDGDSGICPARNPSPVERSCSTYFSSVGDSLDYPSSTGGAM